MQSVAPLARATDHILTIGGGYAPEGNQASLEANVLFFQRVISAQRLPKVTQRIYFADGFDPTADLQIALGKSQEQPTTRQLLDEIFAPPGPPGAQRVGYRNHRVPQINGSNRLTELRGAMESMKSQIRAGDRLIIYVTAHGGSAKGSDPYDTSITCWGNRELTMREFARWLDTLPNDLSVVTVMAQCYCGGFAHALFSEGDPGEGISNNLRTGFFAQRHDLPAAGCRPDIENDEEYSSYFWGALIGQTRSGKPIQNVDCNGDGKISLAEAHAYAVVASETIDIPLRGSDALLRQISRIAYYDTESSDIASNDPNKNSPKEDSAEDSKKDDREPLDATAGNAAERERDKRETDKQRVSDAELMAMSGSLADCLRVASPIQKRIVEGLAEQLQLSSSTQLADLFQQYNQAQREYREARRGGGMGRRGRGSFGRRRDARDAIIAKWPELAETKNWNQSSLLAGEQAQLALRKELDQLPEFEAYLTSRQQREEARGKTLGAEMRQVRFRRLIHTLESIILAANVDKVASPEMSQRYRKLIQLEESPL